MRENGIDRQIDGSERKKESVPKREKIRKGKKKLEAWRSQKVGRMKQKVDYDTDRQTERERRNEKKYDIYSERERYNVRDLRWVRGNLRRKRGKMIRKDVMVEKVTENQASQKLWRIYLELPLPYDFPSNMKLPITIHCKKKKKVLQ